MNRIIHTQQINQIWGGAGYLMTGELIRRVVSAINQGLCDEPKVNYEDVRLGTV